MSTNQVSRSGISKNDIPLKIVTYVISIIIAIIVLLPFYGVIDEACKDPATIKKFTSITKDITIIWKDTVAFFSSANFTGLKNSLIITGGSTFCSIYFSALTAYAITAYDWKLKNAFSKLITVAMMVPSTISIVGFYQLVWKFHLINRLSMLILPAIAAPLTVYFMRMYLQATFSKDILESARIDGASEFRIFNQMILPLLKPAIATQAIFIFVDSWTDVYTPSIILISDAKKTLPITTTSVASEFMTEELPFPLLETLLMVLPPLILFACLSKYLVEGVALGSVKY